MTKYYEYGRYDKDGKGEVRTRSVSNIKIYKYGKPTLESLNKVMGELSKSAGQNGRIDGAYIESDNFKGMNMHKLRRKKIQTLIEKRIILQVIIVVHLLLMS